jgi:hypothetical protein
VTPSTVSALSHWTQLAAAAGQHLHEAVAASSNARGHVTPHGPGSPRAATPFPSEKNVGHLALPELPSLPTPPIVSTEGSPAAAAAVASRDNADPPAGSCPGGGVCNGSGGQTCCQGCPALNNRVMYRTGPGGNAHKKGKKRAESEAAAQSGGGGGGGTAKGSLASASKSSIGASLQLQSGNGSGRMAKVASTGAAERDGAMGAAEGGEASNVGVMECHNCGTRTFTSLLYRVAVYELTRQLRCRNHATLAPRRRRTCRLQRLWSVALFSPSSVSLRARAWRLSPPAHPRAREPQPPTTSRGAGEVQSRTPFGEIAEPG